MRKIFLPITIISFLFIINTISAQKLYIKPAFGYSFGVHKTFLSVYNLYSEMSPDTTINSEYLTAKEVSFGNGFNFEVALGTHINDNMAIELIGFLHQSGEIELESKEELIFYKGYRVSINDKILIEGFMYGINPNLLYSLDKEKMKYYLKAGPILGMLSMKETGEMKIFNTIPGYYRSEISSFKAEYKKQLNIGISVSCGAEIRLMNNVYGFVELKYENIRYIPLEREVVEYKFNDKMELSSLTTSEIFTEYVDSYASADNTENSPTKRLKSSYSFSSIGFLCGIRINILN